METDQKEVEKECQEDNQRDGDNTGHLQKSSSSSSKLETSEEWTILSRMDESQDTMKEEEEEDDISNIRKHEETQTTESDIDVIEEKDDGMLMAEVEDLSASLGSSVFSQMSSLPFLRSSSMDRLVQIRTNHSSYDGLHEDLSDGSSLTFKDELNSEVDLSPGPRAYKHTPNRTMNIKLNLYLALAVTAVIFLGVGNYIGWSSRRSAKEQLNLAQIGKLRSLQDELDTCMRDEDNTEKICYQNTDYWKMKFEKVFKEHQGLKAILEKTQEHYWKTGHLDNIMEEKDCAGVGVNEEFHKLKLDMLVKQMEHLQLLKTYEEMIKEGEQSKEALKKLEDENRELKDLLILEEEDDKTIVETMEGKMSDLRTENEKLKDKLQTQEELASLKHLEGKIEHLLEENDELRTSLFQLQNQLDSVTIIYGDERITGSSSSTPSPSPSPSSLLDGNTNRIETLRQRINDMAAENEELKGTIARIRWSHYKEINVEELKLNFERRLEIEKEEAKKWKKMYEEEAERKIRMKEATSSQSNPEVELGKFREWWNSLDVGSVFSNSMETGGQYLEEAFNSIIENAINSDITIPDSIYNRINEAREAISKIHAKLSDKWDEMQLFNESISESIKGHKITGKMAEFLESSLRKIEEFKRKLMDENKPLEVRLNKVSGKLNKLLEGVDFKWEELKSKLMKATGIQLNPVEDDRSWSSKSGEEGEGNVVDSGQENWYLERGEARRKLAEDNIRKNWMMERARNREEMRMKGQDDQEDILEATSERMTPKKSKGHHNRNKRVKNRGI